MGPAYAEGMEGGRQLATGSGRGEAGRWKLGDLEGDERVSVHNADALGMHTQERARARARASVSMLPRGSNGEGRDVDTGGEGAGIVERLCESSQKSLP